jgi:hypothetical protein
MSQNEVAGNSGNIQVKLALIGAVVSIVGALVTAFVGYMQYSRGPGEIRPDPMVVTPAPGPQPAPIVEKTSQKLCSVWTAGVFRDTINAPDSWTATDCRGFADQLGATFAQLACQFDHGMSWGKVDQTLAPNPDCGWESK